MTAAGSGASCGSTNPAAGHVLDLVALLLCRDEPLVPHAERFPILCFPMLDGKQQGIWCRDRFVMDCIVSHAVESLCAMFAKEGTCG